MPPPGRNRVKMKNKSEEEKKGQKIVLFVVIFFPVVGIVVIVLIINVFVVISCVVTPISNLILLSQCFTSSQFIIPTKETWPHREKMYIQKKIYIH